MTGSVRDLNPLLRPETFCMVVTSYTMGITSGIKPKSEMSVYDRA